MGLPRRQLDLTDCRSQAADDILCCHALVQRRLLKPRRIYEDMRIDDVLAHGRVHGCAQPTEIKRGTSGAIAPEATDVGHDQWLHYGIDLGGKCRFRGICRRIAHPPYAQVGDGRGAAGVQPFVAGLTRVILKPRAAAAHIQCYVKPHRRWQHLDIHPFRRNASEQ